MMGSAPAGGGSTELSFVDVIKLMKDEPAYQTKLRELAKRMDEAAAAQKQTIEIRDKTLETQKFTAEVAAKAEAQLLEAKQLKEEADKQVSLAIDHRAKLAQDQADWSKQVAEQKEKDSQSLISTFATREKEVSAKEKKLVADLKALADQKAAYEANVAAFADFMKAKNSEFARTDADLKGEADRIQRAQVENDKLRQQLQAKLDQIRSITVG